MWTRSAADKSTGLMTVVVTDWNGAEFFRGEFASFIEAERAGEDAERRMTVAMTTPAPSMTIDDVLAEIDDDALLAELVSDDIALSMIDAGMFSDIHEARREIAMAEFMANRPA